MVEENTYGPYGRAKREAGAKEIHLDREGDLIMQDAFPEEDVVMELE